MLNFLTVIFAVPVPVMLPIEEFVILASALNDKFPQEQFSM